LSTPEIEPLYSGVAIRTASASSIAARRSATAAGARVDVVVAVVRRDRLQPVVELELRAGRQQPPGQQQQARVVGVPAQRAGDTQDLH
jgi:hypothetical protein